MAIVPDVSAILALALSEEDARYGDATIAAIAVDEAFVPTLFWFEIRNALLMNERRNRLTSARTNEFLNDLALLPISVDSLPRETTVMDLARRHTLTIHDAAYLELAQRKSLPLATLDGALASAAVREGVEVFATR